MPLGTPLLTSEDVATYFNVDVVTVRRLVSRNELPAYRIGSEYRFALQDVLDFLDRRRIAGTGTRSSSLDAASDEAVQLQTELNFEEHATEAARHVLHLASEEAQQLKHAHIGSEHLLLAIMHDDQSRSSTVLRRLGVVNYSQLRSAVEFVVGQGGDGNPDTPHWTRGTRKIVQLAAEEASKLNHAHIDTPHLLLALCRVGKGPGAGALEVMGVSVDAVRDAVLRELARDETGD